MDPTNQIDPAVASHAKIALAALSGGMVRLFFKPGASLIRSLWLLFCCVTCGFYGTDPAMAWFHIADEKYAGAIGALLGFVGLSLAEALLKAVDGKDLPMWLLHKLKGGAS